MRIQVLLFVLAMFSFSIVCKAQEYRNCVEAMEVCSPDPILMDMALASGFQQEGVIKQICGVNPNQIEFLEAQGVWFKYYFNAPGDFLFTITPPSFPFDIDFVVLRSLTNECDSLWGIRCMFSGENVGIGNDSICLAATGLSYMSADTVEFPGCAPHNDNFLAPVAVEAGDILFMVVTSYGSHNHYTIEHGGTAGIGCGPPNNTLEAAHEERFSVYPNPFLDGFRVNSTGPPQEFWEVEVIDIRGKEVLSRRQWKQEQISATDWPPGMYFLRVTENGAPIEVQKLIKL
jgi:hypothetical protein